MILQHFYELSRCADEGWLQWFVFASRFYQWPLETLLAIASRESNIKNVIGDNGHGYGTMQIDIRTDPSVPTYWQDMEKYMMKAVGILQSKKQWIIDNAGQSKTLRDSKGNVATFVVPMIEEPLLSRVAIAGYNAGAWPVYQVSKGRDPDISTTGKNYSADVLFRAASFADWIEKVKRIAVYL